jgi:hypothetical protein
MEEKRARRCFRPYYGKRTQVVEIKAKNGELVPVKQSINK